MEGRLHHTQSWCTTYVECGSIGWSGEYDAEPNHFYTEEVELKKLGLKVKWVNLL